MNAGRCGLRGLSSFIGQALPSTVLFCHLLSLWGDLHVEVFGSWGRESSYVDSGRARMFLMFLAEKGHISNYLFRVLSYPTESFSYPTTDVSDV